MACELSLCSLASPIPPLLVIERAGRDRRANDADVIRASRSFLGGAKSASSLESPKAVKEYHSARLGLVKHEVFAMLHLDAQHRVIACDELFRGTLKQTSVYSRVAVKAGLARNAAAMILAHKHPSGSFEPSRADEFLTRAQGRP